MKTYKHHRRSFLKTATAGLGFLYLPQQQKAVSRNKKIVCVGGHPDDPESGCGGTLAKFIQAGHDVTIIYLTTGEAGVPDKTHNEAAVIRKQEAVNACSVLKAKPVFAGQVDGDTIVNNEWISKMHQLITCEKPDVLFTHWPVDSHKDHQAASLLTIQAWWQMTESCDLYFFEVCIGEQTRNFQPTDYVDITETQELKHKAVYCHISQQPDAIYACGHAAMEDLRGREIGVKAGEGFVRMNSKITGALNI